MRAEALRKIVRKQNRITKPRHKGLRVYATTQLLGAIGILSLRRSSNIKASSIGLWTLVIPQLLNAKQSAGGGGRRDRRTKDLGKSGWAAGGGV